MLVNDFNNAYSKFENNYFGGGININNIIKITDFNPNKVMTHETL
jgi:hypothetical protein